MPGLLDYNLLAGLLSDRRPRGGLLAHGPRNALSDAIGSGLAPYGFRFEESVNAPFSAKGKGFIGVLPHVGGDVSTEISAHDEDGQGFPLVTPNLSREQLAVLLGGGTPTDDIYRKAQAFAAVRRAAGLSPFAQPAELRLPRP